MGQESELDLTRSSAQGLSRLQSWSWLGCGLLRGSAGKGSISTLSQVVGGRVTVDPGVLLAIAEGCPQVLGAAHSSLPHGLSQHAHFIKPSGESSVHLAS